MDEIAELNRIWEATEARLSALNREQAGLIPLDPEVILRF